VTPALLFHDIYEPGLVYSGFAPPGANRWLPQDIDLLLSITGNQMAVVGNMPLLCSAGSASEQCLDLLRETWDAAPARCYTFRNVVEYGENIKSLIENGMRFVVQHVHPQAILPGASCWIPPSLLSSLNNKGNLADLTPAENVPSRSVSQFDALPHEILASLPYAFPLWLKAATQFSTGGGDIDVHLCRDRQTLLQAIQTLRKSEKIVAEEHLSARRFLCLNYAVQSDGNTLYLGGAEIITNNDGAYRGNWLGEPFAPSAHAIALGRRIAENGATLGYRGILGVDMAEMPNDAMLALDLNFRVCGSTAPLLAFSAASEKSGAPIALSRTWTFDGAFCNMAKSAAQYIRSGIFAPLAGFDPEPHGGKGPAKIQGLLLGENTKDINRWKLEFSQNEWR
jgi:hypothetical protein